MSDVLTSNKPEAPAPLEMTKENVVIPGSVDVEVPFTDYDKEKGHPYVVDHYELGEMWNRGDMYSMAFMPEVETVSAYMEHLISKGEIANTVESVANELKRLEKMINVRRDQKKSVRIGLVAEYAKFLLKSENIKLESAKYGMI